MIHRFSVALAIVTIWTAAIFSSPAASYSPSTMLPPAVPREFRAAWIATVGNIDWPSKPGLTVAEQKAELTQILNRAVKLNLNAVILQVRPMGDAFYLSKYEPWSYYLTGVMGKSPTPFYDPLAYAVDEAHRRGLELHAWFNPYRVGSPIDKFPVSANHITRTKPYLTHKYGKQVWLDPGEKEVQDYSLKVIMDVVQRYDIDGVHFDDYFYPYKENDANKKPISFPDDGSWRKAGVQNKMSREDWRRENVNKFVHRVYESIKTVKPWVKFGISPFGIWQPHNPPSIRGLNSYEELYCDSRKWLTNGWVDYCAPQLYWSIDAPEQSYPVLLKWWNEQNVRHRNLWPGLNVDRVGGKWKASEIENQIKITRSQLGQGAGEIAWSMKTLMKNSDGIASDLERGLYSEQALIPASPWLEAGVPGKPSLTIETNGILKWKPAGFEKIAWWLLQTRNGGKWEHEIVPGQIRGDIAKNSPEVIALTAVDRNGLASRPIVMARNVDAPKASSSAPVPTPQSPAPAITAQPVVTPAPTPQTVPENKLPAVITPSGRKLRSPKDN